MSIGEFGYESKRGDNDGGYDVESVLLRRLDE